MPLGQTYLGVALVGMPDKGVDAPQPGPMGETGEASPTLVGVQHAPNRTDLDHMCSAPQGTCGHTGVGLLEVIWKLVEVIIGAQIKTVVTSHNFLHGFRAKRGTGTAMMEINMAQDLVSIDQDPLFLVLLDLCKSYDTINHVRILHNFEGYGVGPKMKGLLAEFWDNQ